MRLPWVRCVAAMAIAAAVAAVTSPPALAIGRCGSHPWCDTSLAPMVRANMVLARMTTAEKVAFLGGDDFEGGVSSGPNIHTGIQDGVPRLGVPTVYYTDGALGPRQGPSTALPAPLGLAATFDPRMAKLYGKVAANEAKDKGNDAIFGPTINIMRTPLGGRTYEGFGEDPFLVSRMAVPWIRGAQSQGVMADVKHFAENNMEGEDVTGTQNQPGAPIARGILGSRYVSNSIVDDRTLHEVELYAFQQAVRRARVASVMCAYNQVNGTFSCENPKLLQTILRGQWGFGGYVLADYGAAHDTAASLNAGLDFEPWPPFAYQPAEIRAALASGAVSARTLDDRVRDVLSTWFRHGVFDRPAYRNDDAQIDKAAHARDAQRIEGQAVTLLRNRSRLLPLHAHRLDRIAVIGKPADEFVTGGGSGNVTPFRFRSLLAGIRRQAGPGVKVTYDDGSDAAAAVGDARAADVAIVVSSDYYTEGADRSCLDLECPSTNGDQDGLIESVAAANPRTIVVLESGGPDLTPWRRQVGAIVEAWYEGGPGGPAVARVLFGKADPGGRLPVTFPRSEGQIPTAGDPAKYPGIGNAVYYKEGLDVGYRWYDAKRERPAFPFGYGRSYTRFKLSKLRIRRLGSGRYRASVAVRNVGKRRGWAVPELYVHIPSSHARVEPPRMLKGFAKASLAPGERRRLAIRLGPRAFSYWDTAEQRWQVARGCDRVLVGTSSRSLPLRARVCPARGSAHHSHG